METRKNKTGKTLRGLLLMLLMTAAVVALLASVNRLPLVTQKGLMRRYGSIEEAKRALGLEQVLVPSYFPEGITWPPSLVLAQKNPYPAVVMEFKKAAAKETALIVIQASPAGVNGQLQRVKMSELKEETRYALKGKTVILQVGTCDNGMPCSRMAWQDNGFQRTILLMSSPFELIRIAESMIP